MGIILLTVLCTVTAAVIYGKKRYKSELLKWGEKPFFTGPCIGIGLFVVDRLQLLEREKAMKPAVLRLYGRGAYRRYRRLDLADQIARMVLIIGVTTALSLLIIVKNAGDEEIGELARNPFAGEDRIDVLTYRMSVGERSVTGEIEARVTAQTGTPAQQQEALAETAKALPQLILGENTSLERVIHPLNLVTRAGPGIEIRWNSSDIRYLTEDGQIRWIQLEKDATKVELTARMTLGEAAMSCSYPVILLKTATDQQERLALAQRTLSSRMTPEALAATGRESVQLPLEIDGVDLVWHRTQRETSPVTVVLFGILTGTLFWFIRNAALDEAVKSRENKIRLAFPGWVNQFSLLMHAGLSYRSAFEKIGRDYLQSKRVKVNPLYEEMETALSELEKGEGELQVLEQFGLRCHIPEMMRFVSALMQNSRKGGPLLLTLIEIQSREALQMRTDMARRKGESASAHLALPMGIMLLAILLIVMAPAALAFG